MNYIGYDAMTIGNHEFDILQDDLEKTIELANFPILTCNVIDKRTGKLPWYAFPYTIVNRMGLRIGLLGFTTTDTEKMSFPENIKNITFLDEKETVSKYVKILREEELVDLVIVIGHAGLPYEVESTYLSRYDAQGNPKYERRTAHWGWDAQEIAREVEGIDLFIGGHIHKGIPKPWIDPYTHTMVIQGYAYGSNLGLLTLTIDPETKTITGYESPALREGSMITLFEDQFIPDPVAMEMIEAQVKKRRKAWMKWWGMPECIYPPNVDAKSPMGNTIVESMKYMVDADFSFLNLGGVRAEIKYGPVTYRDIFQVMPFDNMVVSFTCDGEFLRRIIETRVEGSRAGLIVAGVNVVIPKSVPILTALPA